MTGSIDEQLTVLLRGAAEEIPKGGLKAALARAAKEGRPLRVKFGMDPSSPDVHLGHTVPLRKLKAFQGFDHDVIFLIGDFTARIGDPTGRNVARPQLTAEQVEANAATYLDQVWKVLDKSKTAVRRNSEWCAPMTFADVIRLASKQNVARILERDDFAKRYKSGQPIAVHEFLYPLVQGYDSVVLRADVEMCSTDQIFNCHVGRALQEADGQPPEVILAMPLIEGTDGVAKMSKSSPEHAIGVTESPDQMYGKLLSIPDALIEKYATLLLDEPLPAGLSPRDAKHALSRAVVTRYHGAQAATAAAERFERTIVRGEAPVEIPELDLRAEMTSEYVSVADILLKSGLVQSKNEARSLVQQRAVEIDKWTMQPVSIGGVEVRRVDFKLPIRDGAVIRAGKRRFVRVRSTYDPIVVAFAGEFTEQEFLSGLSKALQHPSLGVRDLVCRVSARQWGGDVVVWNSVSAIDIQSRIARLRPPPQIDVMGEFLVPDGEMWWSPMLAQRVLRGGVETA